MRLSTNELETIKKNVLQLDPAAEVYLYGSRAIPELKGGDIDLIVISEKLGFTDKLSILVELKLALGEQKIDLSIKSRAEATQDPFFNKVLRNAVLL